jgi:aminoglycoside phosphotransferase (APT) family kinase protein
MVGSTEHPFDSTNDAVEYLKERVSFWDEFISRGESWVKSGRLESETISTLLGSLLGYDFGDLIHIYGSFEGVEQLEERKTDLIGDIVAQLVADPSYRKWGISDSRNMVFTVENSEHFLVIKTSKEKKEILEEEETLNAYLDIVDTSIVTKVAEPLTVLELRDHSLYFLVMKHGGGQTLYEMMDEDSCLVEMAVEEVIDFMAVLHLKYKGPTKGKLNLYEKIRTNLLDPNLGLDRNVASDILYNINPVLEHLISSWHVHNGDSHPENWLIGDGGDITKLDCARSHLIPCELELANLLVYRRFFGDDKIPSIVERYCERTDQRFSEVMPRFYDAIMLRAFALAAAWSDPSRQGLHAKRGDMIANAGLAVELLGTNHPRIYNKHSREYSRLAQNFAKAQKQFS